MANVIRDFVSDSQLPEKLQLMRDSSILIGNSHGILKFFYEPFNLSVDTF
jgi:hypothetical protein